MSGFGTCIGSCCTRYNTPENFVHPADIFAEPGGHKREIAKSLMESVSYFAAVVLINLHNTVMSWRDTSRLMKIVAVIALDLAALTLCAFAMAEGMIRIVLTITCMLMALFFKSCKEKKHPLIEGTMATLLQIPNALYLTVQFSISTKTAKGWSAVMR